VKKRKAVSLKCKTPGCKRAHHAQGYCQNCYDDLRKKKSSSKMKSNTNHKKQAVAAPVKAAKEVKKEVVAELPVTQAGRRTRSRQRAGAAAGAQANASADVQKGRLGLIKARHEAMKREIDQIREDLESDEDE
jgi:hypothetical protein